MGHADRSVSAGAVWIGSDGQVRSRTTLATASSPLTGPGRGG
jgi:hypothetical protein